MPYSVNVSGYDLSSGVGAVRTTAVYTWTELGGPHGAVERIQDELSVDFTAAQLLDVSNPATLPSSRRPRADAQSCLVHRTADSGDRADSEGRRMALP